MVHKQAQKVMWCGVMMTMMMMMMMLAKLIEELRREPASRTEADFFANGHRLCDVDMSDDDDDEL